MGSASQFDADLIVLLNGPSDYPIDAEWRAVFNATIPDLVPVLERASRESSRRLEACMRARGFEFSNGELNGPDLDERVASNPLKTATLQLGYHLPPRPEPVGRTTEISPEMGAALDGGDVSPEGASPGLSGPEPTAAVGRPCNQSDEVTRVADEVRKVDQGLSALVIELSGRVAEYDKLPEAERLLSKWVDCLRSQGFDGESPSSLRQQFGGRATVTDEEVRTRRADYDCDISVGLTQARSDWQREQYEGWRAESAEAIREFTQVVSDFSDRLIQFEAEPL